MSRKPRRRRDIPAEDIAIGANLPEEQAQEAVKNLMGKGMLERGRGNALHFSDDAAAAFEEAIANYPALNRALQLGIDFIPYLVVMLVCGWTYAKHVDNVRITLPRLAKLCGEPIDKVRVAVGEVARNGIFAVEWITHEEVQFTLVR